MTLILNGSVGVSDVDGSAATPAIRGTDANTGMFFPAADTIAFAEGGVEAMRLDSAGNVGIGTTTPQKKLVVSNAGAVGMEWSPTDYTNNMRQLAYNRTTSAYVALRTEASQHELYIGGTEAARINNSGEFLLGATASTAFKFSIESADNQYTMRNSGAAAGKRWRFSCDTNNTVYIINQNTAGVYIGDGSSSWSGLSDERAKDIIEPIQDAANKVCQLRAVIGKYKIDDEGTRRSFLIAQDVQSVLPEAVSVANQETGHLGLSYTDVIPLLVAAIQELKAQNDELKTRVEALETK